MFVAFGTNNFSNDSHLQNYFQGTPKGTIHIMDTSGVPKTNLGLGKISDVGILSYFV